MRCFPKFSAVTLLPMLIATASAFANDDHAASPPTTAPAAQVTIDNFAFTPNELTVPVGTRVTWTNRDDTIHTATSNVKPRLFNSASLDTDQTYSFVFDKPGKYPYFCELHPHMTATIIVTPTK